MHQFFTQVRDAAQPRFPRTIGEGMLKFFMLGGFVLGIYDLSSSPKTDEEIMQKSSRILLGYLFFLTLGAVLGAIGENYYNQERNVRPGVRR